MSDLTPREKAKLEKLFDMQDDDVMDFRDKDFKYFIAESIDIDVGKYKNLNQADILREVWEYEPNYQIGKLIGDLLDYYMETAYWDRDDDRYEYEIKGEFSGRKSKLFDECHNIEHRLLNSKFTNLSDIKDDTFKILLDDINDSLERGTPELIIDRLHVFATKFLRKACQRHDIQIKSEDGKYYPLTNLIAMLKKYYEENSVFDSEFTLVAVKNNIDIFSKYNELRNNKSYAHDNSVLNSLEAEFAIKTIMNTLQFLNVIENRIIFKKSKSQRKNTIDLDNLPF